jgi:hypothetical protein
VLAYGRAGVWAYRRDEWVSSGVRTAEWADVGRGAATDGIRRRGTTARRASMGLMGSNADTPMRRQVNFTTVSPARTPMVWVMLTWAHS